jgi:UrcA family protein
MSRSIILGTAAATILTAMPLQVANAQNDPAQEPAITVLAPRVVEERSSDSIGKTRTLTASSVVYVGDLDLDTQSGRDALKQRVETAAKETCEWLDDLYPLDNPIGSDRNCVDNAMNRAEEQMLAVIADYR